MDTETLRGKYSPMELAIFDALQKQDLVTTDSLLRKIYPRKADEPFNAGIVINRAVITLGQKLRLNREKFRLERKRKPPKRLIETRLIPNKVREAAE